MKKVLSFVLVLAMILGCTAMAFAAPKTAAANVGAPFPDAPTSKVATVLKDLGVLLGDEKGNVNLGSEISRAEFCKILMVALGYDKVGKIPTATKFVDVPADAWYSGYVAIAADLGYVDGRSETTFAPLEKVSGLEAIAFVLKALGYDQAHLAGTWPTNYTTKANTLGILVDLELDTTNCTREEAFTLLYHALDEDLVKYNEKFYEDFIPAGGTLATALGVSASTTVEDLYKDVEGYYVEKGAELANGVSLADYEGKVVTLICKGGTNPATYSIGLSEIESVTLEGSFTTDAKTTFAAIDGTLYKYVPVATCEAIYNNTAEVSDEISTLTSEKALTLEVKLNDKKDGISTIYSASYWTKNATVIVNATQAGLFASGIVASQAAALKDKVVNIQVSDKVIYNFTLEGVDNLADIAEDAVVEVYSAAGYSTKFVVTQAKFEGAVTKYNKKAEAYTVNGTAYTFADDAFTSDCDLNSAVVNAAIKGATEFAFYLNADDEIVLAEFVTEPKAEYEYRYAIVLEATNKVEQTLENKSIKNTTNDAIRLLPLDTLEEEKYEYVSAGSIGNDAILVAATGVWKNGDTQPVKTGEIIKFAVKDDELVKILTQDAFKTLGDQVTFNANGFTGSTTKLFASDATIVVGGVKDKTPAQAAYYVEKTVADLNKTTGTGVYLLNKAGRVETVVLAGYNVAAPAAKVVSAVAFTFVGSDGENYAEFVSFDGTEDSLYISGSAVTEANIDHKLYQITLAGEKINVIDDAAGKVSFTTVGGIKYEDGVLTNADNQEFQCLDPVFFKWNKDDKVLELVDYADDIFAKATGVDTYKINSVYVDVIVIY